MANVNIAAGNGSIVGYVDVVKKVFVKRLKKEHFLRVPPAIAFDDVSLANAKAAGAERIAIWSISEGIWYHTSMERLESLGKPLTRGFGKQTFLGMNYWEKHDPAQSQLQM